MDLGSAQGTFVNGKEIEPNEPWELKGGDRIKFGASTRNYVFQNPAGAEETEEKKSKHVGAASADPELQRMMREMQSFGDKHHQKTSNKMQSSDADTKAEERKKVRLVL
ncbi:unnamed protein product [Phytophthora lilii]|uniref:Unnamed protein product n=1 Tax=Phytophthora lilii TaxID=2077276 RepID=A0A9W6XAS1_9STRA|nr:unnamed protein product [Phytophthora lilii]